MMNPDTRMAVSTSRRGHYGFKWKFIEEQILALIVEVVVSWTTIFLFLRKALPRRSFEFCNRTMSTIHATLAVCRPGLSLCP
ncbi:hypothetical protein MLD38_024783 [Melastoma candidum]|uniref:Uncharacterized protein n=1 Tax=Melastoma candidum TaxID=119954 RepID=A0ACB9NT44_9MYRT|nr:hypothetical protein MLD38_024783 [Melastoma candidum]